MTTPDDAWPAGDLIEWQDDENRVHHDFLAKTTRPYTDAENEAADQRQAETARAQTVDRLRMQLREGVAGITAARDAARIDRERALADQTAAVRVKAEAGAQRSQVAAFVPTATYSAAQLAAVRDTLTTILQRQELIVQALADLAGYRAAVDTNAVTTDDALLWLARLVSGELDATTNTREV